MEVPSMDATTLVIETFGVLVVMAVAISAVRAWRSRPPQLKPLSEDARSRYVAAWDRIEAHFVDGPEEAVRAADALVVSVLGERGHTLEINRLPSRFVRARRMGVEGQGRRGTENLRRALLDYRAIFESAVGSQHREHVSTVQRELA
jgi:hypothetical protein